MCNIRRPKIATPPPPPNPVANISGSCCRHMRIQNPLSLSTPGHDYGVLTDLVARADRTTYIEVIQEQWSAGASSTARWPPATRPHPARAAESRAVARLSARCLLSTRGCCSTLARSNGTTSFSTASTSSIAPLSARNGFLCCISAAIWALPFKGSCVAKRHCTIDSDWRYRCAMETNLWKTQPKQNRQQGRVATAPLRGSSPPTPKKGLS